MNSLFRSIRMSLLKENKTYKYFKYAVGEILLIIVGILFALQINNWNEDRKAQAEFELYIVRLKEDVKRGINYFQKFAEYDKRFGMEKYALVEFLEKQEFTQEELVEFEKELPRLSHYSEPMTEIGFLGELLEGRSTILRRDNILFEKVMTEIGHLKRNLSSVRHIHEANNLRGVNLDAYIGKVSTVAPDMPVRYDMEQLKTSSEFLRLAQTIAAQTMNVGNIYEIIAQRLESLLTVLEEYN